MTLTAHKQKIPFKQSFFRVSGLKFVYVRFPWNINFVAKVIGNAHMDVKIV